MLHTIRLYDLSSFEKINDRYYEIPYTSFRWDDRNNELYISDVSSCDFALSANQSIHHIIHGYRVFGWDGVKRNNNKRCFDDCGLFRITEDDRKEFTKFCQLKFGNQYKEFRIEKIF